MIFLCVILIKTNEEMIFFSAFTVLTWTLVFYHFEKSSPQLEIKDTRRVHLEIPFNLRSV